MALNFRGRVVVPKSLWFRGEFRSGLGVRIDNDGNIAEIGENLSGDVIHLQNEALVPGFVNAHSHAFHRYLRGQSGIGCLESDTFWKWRDAMYKLVADITYDDFKQLCKGTFDEMLRAGITTVGEFHYVHHGVARFDLDAAVIEAASESGIRLVLIETLYSRSGFNASTVTEQQQRFECDVDEFIEHVKLIESKKHSTTTIAVAAHSTRAVGTEAMQRLWEFALKSKKAFHIHLEEQPKEIEDCINSCHKLRPSELLLDKLVPLTDQLTAVHCTYTLREQLQEFKKKQVNVCICPLTEGFLGDGIPDIDENDILCLGTDCNNRICFLEEMRMLAYCQNMKHNRRNRCALDAKKLLQVATENGAKALQLESQVGRFEVGAQFDFVAFDVSTDRLKHFAQEEHLIDAIVFGAGNQEISAVGVSGIGKRL